MQKFQFIKLELDGAYEINPFVVYDKRGNFIKDYSKEIFFNNGICHELKEVFYTTSFKGVIRAIHFQKHYQQPKLVRCIKGKIYDVIVDLRKNSLTFKKWIGIELSEQNKKEIYIPAGFGHGYLVLEDAVVSYKCSEKFYGEYDSGIKWDDETLDIKWPLDLVNKKIVLSDKDEKLQSFEQFSCNEDGGFL